MALTKAKRVGLLAEVPLFANCTKRDLATLASLTVDEAFDRGDVLTREGQKGGLAYVLLSGSATARRGGRKLGRIGAGTVVGELSLIDGGARTATVTADEPVAALSINADDFQKVVRSSPRLTVVLLRTLAARIRDADRKVDLRH